MTRFRSRSTQTSLGPPRWTGWNWTLPVSRIHSRSSGSTTTLCTETSVPARSFGLVRLIVWSGYATGCPSRSSATVKVTSSPHFGKFTKIRPRCDTVTPVGMGPVNWATDSSAPTGSSTGSSCGCTRAASDCADILCSPLLRAVGPEQLLVHCMSTLRLQHDLLAVVEFVGEHVVALRRPVQRQRVRDDEAGVDLPSLDALEQRLHIALHVTLPGPDAD